MSARPESLPNSASNAPTCVAAWRNGRALSSQAMLSEARALADRLPTQGFAVNLCTDRYAFAVAWLACLLRGLTMGLPQDVLPTTLGRLAEQAWAEQPDQSLLALTDVTVPGSALPAPWTSISVGTPPAGAVPDFPLDGWSMEAEAALNAEHVAVKLYTSGSTGSPKAQAKTWHELLRNARGQYTRLCEYLQQASLQCHTVVGTVPPQHSYGLESTVMLPLLGGARLSNRRPYLPDDVRAALEEVPAPRMLVTTPFHLRMLMESGLQWPTVELVLCATAPLSRELAVMAEQAFCGQLIEIYGCTEAGQLASRRTAHTEAWQTLGDIRIDARAMPSDSVSCEAPEFVYWASQGHIPCPVPLADRLDLLDAHHFHLRGRTQDLVHVAGKRTSLGHLNQLLQCIPGVQDGVFWLPAEQADRVVRPVAFVVAPGLEPGLIRDQLRPLMDPVFLPRRLILVEALPREPSGKLTQARMADLAAQHLGPAPAAEAI